MCVYIFLTVKNKYQNERTIWYVFSHNTVQYESTLFTRAQTLRYFHHWLYALGVTVGKVNWPTLLFSSWSPA